MSKLIVWMKSNQLQLNPDKTECIWIRSSCCQHHSFPTLQIGGVTVQPAHSAKSLGVCFDQFLSYKRQLSAVSKTCYFQLHQLRSVCKRLEPETIRSVLQAFISSRLIYCNAVYLDYPEYRLNLLRPVKNYGHIGPTHSADAVYCCTL